MKVDIYQSLQDGKKFVTVEAGKDVSAVGIDDRAYERVRPFKLGVDLIPGGKHTGIDADAAIAGINEDGFYLHTTEIGIPSGS